MVAHRNSAAKLSSVVSSVFVVFLLAHPTQQAPTFECGRSTFTSRIVGGSQTMANEFPWMAHLLIRDIDGQLFHCGGTLISDTHVLTTTRCVVHNQTNKIYDLLKITLGTNVIKFGESSGQVFDWKKIVIPAGIESMEPDIAIVTLSKPVTFTDYVQPACLPFADDTNHVNDSVVLTGWGEYSREYNSSGSVLRKIQTTVLSGGQCQQTARKVPALSANDVICTEQGSGQNCNGDDGGPMNYYNAELKRWFVLGVAGRGDSGDCNSTNKPINVFTRVGSRLDFIRDYSGVVSPITNSNTTTTPEEFTTISYEITTEDGNINETTMETSTETTTNQPVAFTCTGKTDGNYPNPASSCSANFYKCAHGNAYLFPCHSGLVYRAEIGVCDYPFNVAGCRNR
ncbi:chymotrypsin-like elastase family member 2A [Daphnia pulex]|uniref:chymotrypsin-like elastase family member 2A n=1 Tax=Daphnia pulex TaxID=6669 RepID=UPI001EDCE011|nr:chymotrypsin-like elastase family member 2A [Daphnia pulex]